MSFFSSSTDATNLHELLIYELSDLYSAENQILEALPKMAEAASSNDLAHAFREHKSETEDHVIRLDDAFMLLSAEASGDTCNGMKGLLKEGEEVITSKMKGSVKDAALISAAQRVEHYEMAGYGTAHAFAVLMGYTQVAELLQKTLDEEKHADTTLNKISKVVNDKANVRAPEMVAA